MTAANIFLFVVIISLSQVRTLTRVCILISLTDERHSNKVVRKKRYLIISIAIVAISEVQKL